MDLYNPFPKDRLDFDEVKPCLNWVLQEQMALYEREPLLERRIELLRDIAMTLSLMFPEPKRGQQRHQSQSLGRAMLELTDETREELEKLERPDARNK